MRKAILFLFCILISSLSFAQDFPTRFLGIPVDGSKSQMIKKLEAKGFTYDEYNDHLEGEFNGEQVYLLVTTNRNKVWRICVVDRYPTSDVSNIRNRYNRLVEQFFNKPKSYASILSKEQCIIPSDEDISYEIAVHNKQYQVPFYQNPTDEEYSENEKNYAKQFGKNDFKDLTEEQRKDYYNQCFENILGYKQLVWFTIRKDYGDYRLVIFYDNENNHANGEDL